MASISWTRRSYEAAVLVVPLDPTARAWLTGRDGEELAGIDVAGAALATSAALPLPTSTDDGAVAVSSPLEHAVHAADVVVLLAHDLTRADGEAVVRVGDTARATGTLLGAIVVSPGARWSAPSAKRSAATLRDAADSVVVLADTRLVLPFLQVLRGGARDDVSAGVSA